MYEIAKFITEYLFWPGLFICGMLFFGTKAMEKAEGYFYRGFRIVVLIIALVIIVAAGVNALWP